VTTRTTLHAAAPAVIASAAVLGVAWTVLYRLIALAAPASSARPTVPAAARPSRTGAARSRGSPRSRGCSSPDATSLAAASSRWRCGRPPSPRSPPHPRPPRPTIGVAGGAIRIEVLLIAMLPRSSCAPLQATRLPPTPYHLLRFRGASWSRRVGASDTPCSAKVSLFGPPRQAPLRSAHGCRGDHRPSRATGRALSNLASRYPIPA